MRDKITKAALDIVLVSGLQGFTVDDICRHISMSKKTIYKYFRSKNEIISSVVDMHVENDKSKTLVSVNEAKDLLSKLRSVIRFYYDYKIPLFLIDELKELYPDQWQKIIALNSFKQELFKELLKGGIQEEKIKPNINVDILVMILEKTLPSLINYIFISKHDVKEKTANSVFHEFENIIMNGILL